MPKVSVIIPTYNRSKYVTKAIDSVLGQTYKDYEIIVVDDGSTDNTKEVLKPYTDRIKYLYQENTGVSAARNAGIRAAGGQWIAFLDSDDEWLPEKLSIQMDYLSRHNEIVAFITNVKFILPDNKSINLFEMKNYSNNEIDSYVLPRPLIDVLKVFLFALMAKRKILLDIGCFDESMSIYEDADLMRRLALEGPWAISNQCLTEVIRREEPPELNLSRLAKEQLIYSYDCQVRSYEKLVSDSRLLPKEKNFVKASFSIVRFQLAIEQFKTGMKREGLANARQSFLDYPSIKSFIKYMSIKLLRNLGIFLIESKHSSGKKGFRRSGFSPLYKAG